MKYDLSLGLRARAIAVTVALAGAFGTSGAVNLTDQPVFATSNVPGNLALALSVEWPTASRTAHVGNYTSASTYLGYFDPNKCYLYQTDSTANSTNTGDTSYFYPAGLAANRTCTGANDSKWSGNFLNWASTATIDPFRWAMTGGRRVVDTTDTTILEKAWHSGQGLFDDRNLTTSEIAGATPYNGTSFLVHMNGMGFKMRVTATGVSSRTFNAKYYNTNNLSGSVVLTVPNDSADHDWGTGSPGAGVNTDNFSTEMVGTFTAPETGTYVFQTISDDGVRLWVDTTGQSNFSNSNRIINNWTDHGSTTDTSSNVSLTAGQSFSVRIQYYEKGGGAVMRLLWQKPSASAYTTFSTDDGTMDFTMRVKVCDPSAVAGGIESNCKQYGNNYKPEGLIQKYAEKMRFSAFGYLNDSSDQRDGGVLRAQQKFVGPRSPVPGATSTVNGQKEWDETTGILVRNPDSADAAATQTATGVTISDSGVMNYLNQFGQLIPGSYKSYDPVSELYYAVMRYYRNLGNVASWSSMTATDGNPSSNTKRTYVDGFPVITNWADPIQYSCQRNFVLGIGDIYTHVDKNVAGNTTYRTREPGMPAEIAADNTVNAITATNRVGTLQGLGNIGSTNDYSGRNNSAYIAGLAFDANTKDIRPDNASQANTIGKQTVQTYWVDVLEQPFQSNNQFYLAAKFGGMKVPSDFDPYTFAGTIPLDWWSTSGDTLTDTRSGGTTQNRPDNYFAAGQPDTMVAGLTKAFESIANAIKAFTTSFSLSTPQVSSTGSASYASQYDSNGWTGVLVASSLSFATDGTPSSTQVWSTSTTLETQLAGTGWNASRRVVTWNGTAGTPFRVGNLSSTQLTALDPAYTSANDSTAYVNYLRGDRTNETNSTATGSTRTYRARTLLLGDVVDAKVTPVGPPSMTYSDAVNPGYAAFKAARASRDTMVFVAANDGMLHAFNGALTGTNAGKEIFAYIPSATILGPSGTPQTDGLAQLGNPNYAHKYYVNATPLSFDLDFNYAGGTFTTTNAATSDWRTIVIGGLGKGGKSFYAIDVTNPAAMTDETAVASKVLWEFTDTTMGFSFGAPQVIKTPKYGWVVVLTSGYNGSTTNGYIYFVNPRNGQLLEKVSTVTSAPGLAQTTAYIKDFTDGTADAIYAGDLNGNLWRFDVTAARTVTGPYPAPLKLATVTSATGTAQPITTQPLVEIQPLTRKRYIMFGTGQLLDSSDIQSSSGQSFYAIVDGTSTAFGTAAGLPTGKSYPLGRADLTALSDTNLISTTANDFGSTLGWYLDLGATSSIAWRLTSSPTAYNGTVAFSTLLTTGDACSPSGQSRIYAIDFGSGKSVLTPTGTAYVSVSAAVTDLRFVGVDRVVRLIAGDVQGTLRNVGFTPPASVGLRLLNWREVPTLE